MNASAYPEIALCWVFWAILLSLSWQYLVEFQTHITHWNVTFTAGFYLLSALCWASWAHSRALAAWRTQLFDLAAGCCGASQHLRITRSWVLVLVQCPLKSEIYERYIILLKIRLAYHEVSLQSCSPSLTGSTACVCVGACWSHTNILAAHSRGYSLPLSMTSQFTELASLLLPTEPLGWARSI